MRIVCLSRLNAKKQPRAHNCMIRFLVIFPHISRLVSIFTLLAQNGNTRLPSFRGAYPSDPRSSSTSVFVVMNSDPNVNRKVASEDHAGPKSSAKLFSTYLRGSVIDVELDDLVSKAAEACTNLQDYVGTNATIMLLAEAPLPPTLSTAKRLKAGESKLLLPLYAPILEPAFRKASPEALECYHDFRNAINRAKDEHNVEARRLLLEASVKNDVAFGIPAWIEDPHKDFLRLGAPKRISIHPLVYQAFTKLSKQKLSEIYNKLFNGFWRRALDVDKYTDAYQLCKLTPPWLPKNAHFVCYKSNKLFD